MSTKRHINVISATKYQRKKIIRVKVINRGQIHSIQLQQLKWIYQSGSNQAQFKDFSQSQSEGRMCLSKV